MVWSKKNSRYSAREYESVIRKQESWRRARPTATWGTIVGVGILDAASGGNLLYYGPLSVPRTVNNGDSFSVAINGMTVTEA
jgi:hypothetical protein